MSPLSLLTAAEVAEHWKVPESWIRAQSRAGILPTVRLGRYRRYDLAEVEAWLNAQRTSADGLSGRTCTRRVA